MARSSLDEWAMAMVVATAKRSTCCRRNVGCVLLNARGHVLATGNNGVARGEPHCNEVVRVINPALVTKDGGVRASEHWEVDYVDTFPNACSGATAPSGTDLDGCKAVHAEQNALMQCDDIFAIETAYVSASPCMTCCKMLLNTSCRRIVFLEEYPHPAAKELWVSKGRVWEKFTPSP